MNRRSFLKNMARGLIAVAGLSSGGYYYAYKIEPTMLQISEETITSSKIPKSFNNFKIIQFSDTHIGFHYTIEQLNKLVHKINDLEPNLILFTGDLVDKPQTFDQANELIRTLDSLQATHGKYWVYGNHDHGGYGTEIIRDIMDQANFRLLKNTHAFIEKNKEHIVISGVDDIMLGKPDLTKTLKHVNADLFTILLAHEPDFATVAAQFPVDVQLSGHSHGGQIRLPFIGHLYTPAYAKKYIHGRYLLNNKLELYVNKGIGTTRLPLRFFCKPEIHSFLLNRL